MCIQPQNPQPLVRRAAMLRDSADASNGQAVISTQQDGQRAVRQLGSDCQVNRLNPGNDLGEVSVPASRRLAWIGRALEVSTVKHVHAVRLECHLKASDAQCLRPHAGSACARPDVGWCADQADRPHEIKPRGAVGGDRAWRRPTDPSGRPARGRGQSACAGLDAPLTVRAGGTASRSPPGQSPLNRIA